MRLYRYSLNVSYITKLLPPTLDYFEAKSWAVAMNVFQNSFCCSHAGSELLCLCSGLCVVRVAKEVHHLLLWRLILHTKFTGKPE